MICSSMAMTYTISRGRVVVLAVQSLERHTMDSAWLFDRCGPKPYKAHR